jgi:AcrR family transcriptional regulator
MTDVQKRILDVASRLFAESGYQSVSLRQIADAAHVNASIIIRHFGSKDKLFLLSLKGSEDHENILEGPRESLGKTIVTKIIDSSTNPHSPARNMEAMIQVISHEGLREEMKVSTIENVVKPLMKIMNGPNVELRASLVAAQISGLLMHLYALNNPILHKSEKHNLTNYFGAALQTLIDNPVDPDKTI